MLEETPEIQQETPSTLTAETKPEVPGKKKGRFFRKIPKEFLFSPGGVILVLLAVIIEIIDILIPGGSLTIEIIPDAIFAIFLSVIAKVPLTSSIIPFLIERIPVISDILPTWLIRMFM
jgi:hypothetical protein